MAPIEQYFMEPNAEIALARTGGPQSIAADADVMVLGKQGYESSVKGKNGFVCAVLRSWTAGSDDPDFWNPKLRAPICFNAAAAHSYWPLLVRKTEIILAGRPKAEMFSEVTAAIDAGKLPKPEVGAMCYMLSKQGYLNDRDGHWHPHLMFFLPLTEPAAWGANATGAPIIAAKVEEDRLTVFLVPVPKWSDGTADEHAGH